LTNLPHSFGGLRNHKISEEAAIGIGEERPLSFRWENYRTLIAKYGALIKVSEPPPGSFHSIESQPLLEVKIGITGVRTSVSPDLFAIIRPVDSGFDSLE
jgi:hypothetical protein